MKKKNNLTFFKGFDKNMQCRGFQYVEGETYTQQGKIGVCVNGFHACGLPLDVWFYYPLRNGNLYHEVTLDGIAKEDGGDSKVAAREITVGASLDLVGLIRAHVEAVFDLTAKKSELHAATTGNDAHAATTGRFAHAATTGRYAHAATTGDSAHAATTGDSAHAATTGYEAHAATTGRFAHATTTGYEAHAATTGDSAHATTTGDEANAATTGDGANAATTGDSAHAATTGRYANAATTGYSTNIRTSVQDRDSVSAVLGQGAAKGVKGSWLVLTERNNDLTIVEVRATQVDGKNVKADTYYQLINGELVEVDE